MRIGTAASFSSDAICPKRGSERALRAASPNVSDTQSPLASLADRVRRVDVDATIVGVHFLGGTPVFVLGEEALLYAGERRVGIHAGAILYSASDGTRIGTGGEDGKISDIEYNGQTDV